MNQTLSLIPAEHMMLIALAVGGAVRIIKTDTMSAWLEKMPPSWIGAVPKGALPWLALFLAMVVSVVDALWVSKTAGTWQEALVAVVQGVFSGSLAIAGHETLAKTVGKVVKLPPPPTMMIGVFFSAIALLTATPSCAPVFAALPHVIAAVVDAQQIIDTIVTFVDRWFVAHPDPVAKAKVDAAVMKTRAALNVLLRAANGAEKVGQEKIDAAFADFKAAYLELIALVHPYGVNPSPTENFPKLSASGDTLTVPTPVLITAGVPQ